MTEWLAMRNFLNVPKLAIAVEGKVPKEVVRGQKFSLGQAEVTADLTTLDPKDNERAQFLLRHNMGIFANDPANKGRLETLTKELATEDAVRRRDAAKPKAISIEELLAQVTALTQKVLELTPKPKAA